MTESEAREGLERRGRREQGWVGTAAALVALVLVGFLGGALIGFLWEEPRLVFAYLSGDTDAVEWSSPVLRDVAAPPPSAVAEEVREAQEKSTPLASAAARPAAQPKPQAKPKPAPKSAARTSSRFAVQVGAFSESRSAERLADQLRKRGHAAYVAPASSGAARWRVRVGPVPTRPEAEALAEKLKRNEELSTWVLDENAS